MARPVSKETQTLAGAPELVYEVAIAVGPDTYGAWLDVEAASATMTDVAAAVEEDMRRFRRAWEELARA